MTINRRLLFLLAFVIAGFAQTDRGTITGTVSDSTGAVIASAPVEARNLDTGAVYDSKSSTTGNYSLPELPAGTYQISATVPGFKKITRTGLVVAVAQTLRIDLIMEVGSSSESVTVMGAAPLLETESGAVSYNITTKSVDDLPVLVVGAGGSAGVRNPLAPLALAPGVLFQSNAYTRVNGAPANSMSIRIDGQDASNGYLPFATPQVQPSVDAIEEVSVQTSNYSAEFGQVGGGYLNYTMKSGTNSYHGTGYDYFQNEFLNAGLAWTNNGNNQLIRPETRRNDWGFTAGGPVRIPKVYNGRDKTFFFVNYEEFHDDVINSTDFVTVPTLAMRTGDFSSQLGSKVLATDPLGRPIMLNEIYDPATQRLAPNGQTIRDPFPKNQIPVSRFDPIAAKIQNNYIPPPNTGLPSAIQNNWVTNFASPRYNKLPSVKLDEYVSSKLKVSFFWSLGRNTNCCQITASFNNGFPPPAMPGITNTVSTNVERLNIDYTLSPTLLLHFGAGYQGFEFNNYSSAIPYDAAQLGIPGLPIPDRQFPYISGLNSAAGSTAAGLSSNLGPAQQYDAKFFKPSAVASLSWVKDNHTYRVGGEFRIEGYMQPTYTDTAGQFTFSNAQTGLPSTNGQNLSGNTIGLAYASFLLGQVGSVTAAQPAFPRIGDHKLGLYVQDSWKISRRFTLEYGLRYDFQSYVHEQYGRLPDFSPTTLNANFGNIPGAAIFEGSGAGRCNCAFAKNYPYAIGPRLGFAYQILPKTVLRGGFGVVYSSLDDGGVNSALALATSFQSLTQGSAGFDQPVTTLTKGIPFTPSWPNFNQTAFPFGSVLTNIDPNAGRPARQAMWSLGVQREIFRNLAVSASYVGNRGAWWQADTLTQLNLLTPQILAAHGLSLANAADLTLLTSTLSSSTAASRGFSKPPYPGFPLTSTVAQALRPFPQYGSIDNLFAPLGDTWYHSLQAKVTKRLSYGLDLTYAFTWAKSETIGAESELIGPGGGVAAAVTDQLNRPINKTLSGYDQPFVSSIAFNYRTPKLPGNKLLRALASGWVLGSFMNYASGLPIPVPQSQNKLSSVLLGIGGNNVDRVPGVPLLTVPGMNCNCYDPANTFVLNPAAWAQPPAGQFGTAAPYYSDYRYRRRPSENASIGRIFKIREHTSLQIRAEWFNIFNRLAVPNPSATNALATQVRTATGTTQSGFGAIVTSAGEATTGPRNGQIVAKIIF